VTVSIRTLQHVDRRLGPLAHRVLQPLRLARRKPPEKVRRLLIVKFFGLGSLTLLGPAVRVLRRRFPGAEIDLLTLEGNTTYARRLGAFDDILYLSLGHGWRGTIVGIARMLRAVRRRGYDRLYDFEFLTHFSALSARLSRAKWIVGYSAPEVWRGGFFDETVAFNRYWHVARNARSLAGGENGRDVELAEMIRPGTTAAGREEAARALADGPVSAAKPIVVVNPNAGQLALERRWPRERMVSLLNGLLGSTDDAARLGIAPGDLRVVLIGAADERDHVESIRLATLRPDSIDDLAGRLSIDGLLALLERAALLVSNDSGPLHLAAALGRPVVALFGPETPVMYAPLSPRATILYKPPACSPCINVHDNKMATCHLGHPLCLEGIEPVEVLAAAAAALRAPAPSAAAPSAAPGGAR
jgi:ADP-heptose:LPS heptosyltransferase